MAILKIKKATVLQNNPINVVCIESLQPEYL